MMKWNPFSRTKTESPPLYLFNTLGKEKQLFTMPPHAKAVRMYNCGPTVYGPSHIGNLSGFVFADILRRTLQYNGFRVKQVINITDFGHLTSDADEGTDKMTKGLKREGMKPTMANMATLAERYAQSFIGDLEQLNIDTGAIEFPRASRYVAAQIAMIKTLEEKEYAYRGAQGVYYDTSRFPSYGALGGIDLTGLKEGARVAASGEKRNPTDFLLWKSDKKIGWDSPWGKGFPGWHIECSAMIHSLLGSQIDIHTGGIDLIPTHHNNEIAQSEAATGKKPFVRYWLHRAHIQIEGAKIAKSEGSVVYLSDILERGYHPLSLRYFFLGAHYRTPANFSWEALAAAQAAFAKLVALRLSMKDTSPGQVPVEWQGQYRERINDDLDTPGALAVLWDMTKDADLSSGELLAGVLDIDAVLGLRLADPDEAARALAAGQTQEEMPMESLPPDVRALIALREEARKELHYDRADELRRQAAEMGFHLEDIPGAVRVFRK